MSFDGVGPDLIWSSQFAAVRFPLENCPNFSQGLQREKGGRERGVRDHAGGAGGSQGGLP